MSDFESGLDQSETSNEMRQQMDSLRSDLNQLKGDMRQMLQMLVQTGKSEAVEMKDRVEGQVRETAYAARDQGRQMIDNLETKIEQNPMTSVMTALGIGFIIGALSGRN